MTPSHSPETFIANTQRLLEIIKDNLPHLEKLLEDMNTLQESLLYRCYQNSFKIYDFQEKTIEVVGLLRKIGESEGLALNEHFEEIIGAGTGKYNINEAWALGSRPIFEAFMHTRLFLEIMVKYAKNTKLMSSFMPYGWMAVLELYSLGL